jgi:hypothetical protein
MARKAPQTLALPELDDIDSSFLSDAIRASIEAFMTEALAEAQSIIRHGDMASKLPLIKMVLAMALKAQGNDASTTAESILTQARSVIADIGK